MINKNKIISVIEDIRNYFYPNIFEEVSEDIESYKMKKLLFAKEKMALELSKKNDNYKEINQLFFEEVINLEPILKEDVKTCFKSDPAAESEEEIVLSYPGIFAIFVYRIANILYRKNISLIPRIMSEYAHQVTGIDIHPGASIGRKFFIDHGTGIVIGETTIIGDEVKIYQGVTLGAMSLENGRLLKDNKRHPTIKNKVTIYANATILGGNTVIGNNVTIGGNVFITSSVNDNTTVILKSPELIYKDKEKK